MFLLFLKLHMETFDQIEVKSGGKDLAKQEETQVRVCIFCPL